MKLFRKLVEHNFDSNALSMMKSHLTESSKKVTLPNCSSDWIKLYQGVPRGTIHGPLFNIYVNDKENVNDNQCKIIQNADVTMVFCSHEEPDKAKSAVEKIVQKLVTYFETHQLTINAQKTEFIISCRQSKNGTVEHLKLQVKDQIIETSSCVKYLGVCLDRNLTFQNEVKNILSKIATGIKVLYNMQNIFPGKTRLLLLNALLTSHLRYSVILLGGIREIY